MSQEQNSKRMSCEDIERRNSVTMAVHKLFMDMHGAYGLSWAAKWETGQQNEDGKDIGVVNAKRLWSDELYDAGIDPQTIAVATKKCYRENDKAPNFALFFEICKSIMPCKNPTYKDCIISKFEIEAPVVIVDYEHHDDGLDWARKIVAKDDAGYHISFYAKKAAVSVLNNRM
jgi:hypothetical protein